MELYKLLNTAITTEMFAAALQAVRFAAANYFVDASRREYAVNILAQQLGVPEHLARLLVELAVFATKQPVATPSAAAETHGT